MAGQDLAIGQDSELTEGRLSFGEKVGYSLGDAASNFYWKTFEFFIIFFYTDVFGISAGAVGTMMLVTRPVVCVTGEGPNCTSALVSRQPRARIRAPQATVLKVCRQPFG